MSATTTPQNKTTDVESEDEPPLPYDECFDLLSSHRRRYALHYLKHHNTTVELGDLAEQIAAWENGVPITDVSYDQRKRVYTSLQQVHLPRMDDVGVVEFDDREGTVELGPAADNLDIYLEVVHSQDIPWSVFYPGLAAVNLLVVGAYVIGVPGSSAIPAIGIAVFVVTSFLVASLAHLYVSRAEMRLGKGEVPPELNRTS